MSKSIRVTDIKWAYSKELRNDVIKEFFECLCLFVCEIIRSDEIGLIVFCGKPTLMVRVPEIDLKSENIHAEMMNFKESKIEDLFIEVKAMLIDNSPRISCAGFEIFCYRPKPEMPYHPFIHPTYNRAREKASRVLSTLFTTISAPDSPCSVSFAQVSSKTFKYFFKNSKQEESHQKNIMRLIESVDTWISEFYTDEIGSKQYKTTNRYPLSPRPIESGVLHVITADENGNFMAYKKEV